MWVSNVGLQCGAPVWDASWGSNVGLQRGAPVWDASWGLWGSTVGNAEPQCGVPVWLPMWGSNLRNHLELQCRARLGFQSGLNHDVPLLGSNVVLQCEAPMRSSTLWGSVVEPQYGRLSPGLLPRAHLYTSGLNCGV